jgi:hypothetical protein
MAIDPTPTNYSTFGNVQELRRDLVFANSALGDAQSEAEAKVKELNSMQLRDSGGNLIQCKTVKEWQEAFAKGNVKYANGNYVLGGPDDKNSVSNRLKVVIDKLTEAEKKVSGLNESIESLEAMDTLLQTGDVMGAFNRLAGSRAKGFQDKLDTNIQELKARNTRVQQINTYLGQLQGTTPRDEVQIKQYSGLVDKLNSDTQLQMIDVNDMVSKKNQCFEMMTSIATKWSQTMQQVIGNLGRG